MQLVKNEIWRSHGLKSEHFTSCLSAIVLDPSDELPHRKSHKENRFIYRFVHQKLPSHDVYASDGDSFCLSSSAMNDLDHTLKIGDYVVLLFSRIKYLVHNVTLLN